MAYKPESQDAAQKDWTKEAGEIALLKGILQVLQSNALGIDLQYSSIAAEKVTVIGGMDVRETNRYWEMQTDFSVIKNTVFKVSNTTDQDLKVLFHVKDIGPFKKADGTDMSFTIKADTSLALITPDDLPLFKYPFKEIVVLQIQPVTGTAPTRGQLNIDAYTTPIL